MIARTFAELCGLEPRLAELERAVQAVELRHARDRYQIHDGVAVLSTLYQQLAASHRRGKP
jgi:hypothetical protein